jgi:co-chaperonin GroES (HSP10)
MKFREDTLGVRVVLKPFVERKSKGGIDLSALSVRSQAINTDKGEILLIGPAAWYDKPSKPNLKVGDKVFYAKYGAKTIRNPAQPDPEAEDAFFVMCNDEDILGGYDD